MNNNYLAGIFDGEGWVGVERYMRKENGKMRHRLAVVICNTDRRIVDLIHRHIGHGSVTTVEPPPDKPWKALHRWTVKGGAARFFLEQIAGLAFVKREQIEVALDGPDDEEKWTRLKQLNRRGAAIGNISGEGEGSE